MLTVFLENGGNLNVRNLLGVSANSLLDPTLQQTMQVLHNRIFEQVRLKLNVRSKAITSDGQITDYLTVNARCLRWIRAHYYGFNIIGQRKNIPEEIRREIIRWVIIDHLKQSAFHEWGSLVDIFYPVWISDAILKDVIDKGAESH
jgi:hypothetical protein